jgi:preprotein translocase subunit Sss1
MLGLLVVGAVGYIIRLIMTVVTTAAFGG